MKDLSAKLLAVKQEIKLLIKIKQNSKHSQAVLKQNELKRRYNYYKYVRGLEKFHSSYIYRLKKLRGKK